MKYFRQHLLPSLWNKKSFTLIELTITLALVMLAISISLPVVLNTHHLYVATQARTLQVTCWALQQQAFAQNKQITLKFNQTNNSYNCYPAQHTKLAPRVKFGVIPGVLGPPASPQKQLTHAITFLDEIIVFYPDGRISPGSVYLVDDARRILYAVTVSVASISSVRLYRNIGGRWQLV